MRRVLLTVVGCAICVATVACGGGRSPGSTANAAGAARQNLTVRAEILRAEDRRTVDDALLSALRHDEPTIRALAVRAVGRIGDPAQAKHLVTAAKDKEADVRAAAAYAIGLIGDTAAIDTLNELAEDRDAKTRAAAADALGLVGTDACEGALSALLRDQDPSVVLRACFAVPRLEHPGFAVDQLDELSKSDQGEVVFACTWSLSQLASQPERLDRQKRRTARDRMIELTASPYVVIRQMAATGLTVPSREEEAASVGPLVEDPEPSVRIAAIRAISFPGAPIEPFLSEVLMKGEEEDARVYLELVDALGRMRGADVVEALADIVVHDPRLWIQERAIYALGKASNYSAKMANGLSRSEAAALRRATAALLVDRIDDETIQYARRLYEDDDPSVRAAIIPAMAEVDGLLSETLASSIGSDDPRVRSAVVAAAGRVLADENAQLEARRDAIDILDGSWQTAVDEGDPTLAEAVMQAADDAQPGPDVQALLERGLDYPAWRVRVVASDAWVRSYGALPDELGPAVDRPLEDYIELLRWADVPRAAIVTVERPGFLPGRFTLALDTANAPLSARQFAEWAEAGEFDDVPFYRLVPNVALYTGAELSAGLTDTPADLRDETSDELMLSGSLAWSAGGRDRADGGWFISLSPRPELLGRVTTFGRVVQNLSGVVALVLPDDVVKSVKLYEGDGSEPLPAN